MTQLEIVLETVREYNSSNSRALFYKYGTREDAVAVYQDVVGRRCAVGRCLNEYALKRFGSFSRKVKSLFGLRLDRYLKEGYKGHMLKFWEDLQELHDKHEYWSDRGINSAGKKFVLEKFKIDLDKHKI